MSKSSQSFLQLALRGEVLPDELDDFIECWHTSASDLELREYLGFSRDEYALWISDPSYLGIIIAARSNDQLLTQAVNDNYADLSKLAARSTTSKKIKKLKTWLEEQEGLALGEH